MVFAQLALRGVPTPVLSGVVIGAARIVAPKGARGVRCKGRDSAHRAERRREALVSHCNGCYRRVCMAFLCERWALPEEVIQVGICAFAKESLRRVPDAGGALAVRRP